MAGETPHHHLMEKSQILCFSCPPNSPVKNHLKKGREKTGLKTSSGNTKRRKNFAIALMFIFHHCLSWGSTWCSSSVQWCVFERSINGGGKGGDWQASGQNLFPNSFLPSTTLSARLELGGGKALLASPNIFTLISPKIRVWHLVSRLLGIETFLNFLRVSVSVSKILVSKKSLGIGLENI